jgi:hypothetical protein
MLGSPWAPRRSDHAAQASAPGPQAARALGGTGGATAIFDWASRAIAASAEAVTERGPSLSSEITNWEWEVVFSTSVNIRSWQSFNATIVGQRPPGWVFVGHREGNWLRLDAGAGYVAITVDKDLVLLRQRPATYTLRRSGSCARWGENSVGISSVCRWAARGLGWSEGVAEEAGNRSEKVRGCYAKVPSTRNLAVICSSAKYPQEMTVSEDTTYTTTLAVTTTAQPTTTSTVALTTTTRWQYPSMFCWMVTMTHGDELALVKMQHRRGWGIWTCEEHAVHSDVSIEIGLGERTVAIGTTDCIKGSWGSWVNTKIFVKAWDAVLQDGRYKRHDWVVKVDPDTVFFPHRMKAHLKGATGDDKWWLKNTLGYPTIGALEVFSRAAVLSYGERKEACRDRITGSAEDQYICDCMSNFGAWPWKDLTALQHKKGDLCLDESRIAFHPFKNVLSYERCMNQVVR